MAVSDPTSAAAAPEAFSRSSAETGSSGAARWGYFLLLHVISGLIAAAFLVAVFEADAVDPYMRATYEFFVGHPALTSVAAFSPLASSLLVGWGYVQRARKRKAAVALAARPLQPSLVP